jgi:hypothetical protein
LVLHLSGAETKSVFGLLGSNENAATFALGWALEKSPYLLRALLDSLELSSNFGETVVTLQRFAEDRGFSDIELRCANAFHVIVEAKKGWQLPEPSQLERYAPRFARDVRGQELIVSISAASEFFAERLPRAVAGIPVKHLSWSSVNALAATARSNAKSSIEKLWLFELSTHLEQYTMSRQTNDNDVYVVSLSSKPIVEGSKYTWIDVVEQDRRYFHPIGPTSSWPTTPPNYIGFRYEGRLQSIHHVRSFQVISSPSHVDSRWIETDQDHFLYELGTPIVPHKQVRTGNLFQGQRVRCAIDTLLSGDFETIFAARDETKRRKEAYEAVG